MRLISTRNCLPDRDDVTSIVASGDDVPLPDGSAALVTTHFVLARIARANVSGILREAYRRLAPRGQLMLVEPCLSLSMYAASETPQLSVMMSLALTEKAAVNDEKRDIDENMGLRLSAMVRAAGFLPDVEDLHIARWFSAFPSWGSGDEAWMSPRIADLEAAGGADFLNVHTVGSTGFADADEVIKFEDGRVRLKYRGFEAVQAGRIADLRARRDDLSGGLGPAEMIPVVRVVARKPS